MAKCKINTFTSNATSQLDILELVSTNFPTRYTLLASCRAITDELWKHQPLEARLLQHNRPLVEPMHLHTATSQLQLQRLSEKHRIDAMRHTNTQHSLARRSSSRWPGSNGPGYSSCVMAGSAAAVVAPTAADVHPPAVWQRLNSKP